jgi:MYXO-CTERM domain-containing protein
MTKILGLLALAGAATVANAQWTTQTITSGNVVATHNLPTSNTASAASSTADFRVNGATGTDHLFTNWWWARAGADTREHTLSVATAQQGAVVKTFTADSVTWSNIQVPAAAAGLQNIRFTLTQRVVDLDGAGGLQGQWISSLTATNIGTTTVTNLNLFNNMDYFFTGEDGGDVVPVGDAGIDGSGNRFIKVSDPSDTGGFGSMYHQGIGATGYGAGSFSTISGQFGDTGLDNFADINSATVAGDQTGVMQWNFGDLAPGASATAVSVLTIPTPGALALVGLGGLVAARRRRA